MTMAPRCIRPSQHQGPSFSALKKATDAKFSALPSASSPGARTRTDLTTRLSGRSRPTRTHRRTTTRTSTSRSSCSGKRSRFSPKANGERLRRAATSAPPRGSVHTLRNVKPGPAVFLGIANPAGHEALFDAADHLLYPATVEDVLAVRARERIEIVMP